MDKKEASVFILGIANSTKNNERKPAVDPFQMLTDAKCGSPQGQVIEK
jgi:hypothetical protein